MRFNPSTPAALAALTEALDEPGADIGQLLDRLGEIVASTVTSFIALSIRTGPGVAQVEFIAPAAGHDDLSGIRSSLLMPLPDHGAAGTADRSQATESQAARSQVPGSQVSGSQVPGSQVPGSQVPGSQVPGSQVPASPGWGSGASLILYVGQPGAFVDLAADIAWITGLDHDRLRIDEHLEPSTDAGTALTPAEWSMRNQAVGTLIEQGFRPEDAHAAVARFSGQPDELAEQVAASIRERRQQ